MAENTQSAKLLLRKTRVEVAPETYTLISLRHEDWRKLLENPELSPRMTAPFMIFSDKWEVTLLLDDIDFQTIHMLFEKEKLKAVFGFKFV